MKTKKRICHNCQFAGNTFKLNSLTHMHCEHPKYTQERWDKGEFCEWDTLQEFWNTCKDFEYIKGEKRTDSIKPPISSCK